MAAKRNIYFCINERNAVGEDQILIVPAKGNEYDDLIQALRDWNATNPNSSFDRIYRSEISPQDLAEAIPMEDFEFCRRPNDSEILNRQRDFERIACGAESEDEDEYEHRDQCGF